MKIQLASDLHLEFLQQRFPNWHGVKSTDADVLILAGDIHTAASGIASFKDWPVPVVYVHGNHELYGEEYASGVNKLRQSASSGSVKYLDQDVFIHHGVRFLGTCLWTDYLLFTEGQQSLCMHTARAALNDHRLIQTDNRPFSPQDALACHQASIAWLEAQLSLPFDGKTVVVTHHAPHFKSVHPRFANDFLTAAFASDLSALIERHQPELWCHGHMHDSSDYMLGNTRVLANPRGYPVRSNPGSASDLRFENPAFEADLVLDIT